MPQIKKRELLLLTRINLIKNFFMHTLSLLLVFLSFLVIFYYNLTQQLENLNQSRFLVNSSFVEYNQEIRKLNKNINNLNAAGLHYHELTPKFLHLVETVPENIKLSSLSLNLDKKAIFIPGTAKNRDALLNYGEILSKIPWIKHVDIPKTQLLQKENINFNIGVEMN